MRAVADGRYSRVVLAMAAQGGKSEALLDIIGERLDTSPVPILYVAPTQKFIREKLEPRVMKLLDEAPRLAMKVARGKRNTKTRKVIGGVPLQLAHAGSSSELKSEPFGLAVTDEADELMANVKNQGDPIGLIDRRGETYADFVHAIVSTPSEGPSEVERDPESGLEFWGEQDPETVNSKIWNLWQEGTRHHWAWPCPHCGEYFIPRFQCLECNGKDWRKVAPAEALTDTVMVCPNGCIIKDEPDGEDLKKAMNERGVYVAPGQWVTPDGVVHGDPPERTTVSFWVSGLASPFRTWGRRAHDYVVALRSGDQGEVQTVMNGGFGELWSPVDGDAPEWEEVKACALPYQRLDLPEGVRIITMGVDVQGNRLVYVIRGYGAREESWLLDAGELYGPTSQEDVWLDLADVIEQPVGGRHIHRVFVDAGFRPGKKDMVPEHRVYEFARRHSRVVFPSKGFETRPTPVQIATHEVNPDGSKASRYTLQLARLDTDFLKSWVHSRIRWPKGQPGAWHVFQDITEQYCRQVVSEVRGKKPQGGYKWVPLSRDNHFLDAEAMAYAAAYSLRVYALRGNVEPQRGQDRPTPEAPVPTSSPTPAPTPARAPAAEKPRAPIVRRRNVHRSSYM